MMIDLISRLQRLQKFDSSRGVPRLQRYRLLLLGNLGRCPRLLHLRAFGARFCENCGALEYVAPNGAG